MPPKKKPSMLLPKANKRGPVTSTPMPNRANESDRTPQGDANFTPSPVRRTRASFLVDRPSARKENNRRAETSPPESPRRRVPADSSPQQRSQRRAPTNPPESPRRRAPTNPPESPRRRAPTNPPESPRRRAPTNPPESPRRRAPASSNGSSKSESTSRSRSRSPIRKQRPQPVKSAKNKKKSSAPPAQTNRKSSSAPSTQNKRQSSSAPSTQNKRQSSAPPPPTQNIRQSSSAPSAKNKRKSSAPTRKSTTTMSSSDSEDESGSEAVNLHDTVTLKRRYKRPNRSEKEIRHFQRTTDMLIPRNPFCRLVREITTELTGVSDIRYMGTALQALQEATESYMTGLMEDSYLISLHAKRVTLTPHDIRLAYRIRGDGNFHRS